MSDDIVIGLREAEPLVRNSEMDCDDVGDIIFLCADEIERLRADRDRWRNWAEEYFYTDPDCECPLCDQVRAAIGKTI